MYVGWCGVVVLFQMFVLGMYFLIVVSSGMYDARDAQPYLRTHSPSVNGSWAPSASPTFVVPIVVVYLSSRSVPGYFMARGETPEGICEEEAHARHGCDRVSALVSTRSTPVRRRVRDMKHVFVYFQDHHVIAHDVADLWTLGEHVLGLPEEVWTGSNPDGGAAEDGGCDDWTGIAGYGVVGRLTVSDGEVRCDQERKLLCICKTKL